MIMVSTHPTTYQQLEWSNELELEGRVAYSRHWNTKDREPSVRTVTGANKHYMGMLAQNEVHVHMVNSLFQRDYNDLATALQEPFREQIMKLSPELKASYGIPDRHIQMTLVPNGHRGTH